MPFPHRLMASGVLGGGIDTLAYAKKVLAMESASLIACWPLSETAGAVADNAEGTAARDGAYTGVTLGQTGIGDGLTCPLFDGLNDVCNVYSASLATAFNGNAGTIQAWIKVSAAGVWTDTTQRNIFTLVTNGISYARLYSNGTGGLVYDYLAGGTQDGTTIAMSSAAWIPIVMTWDSVADQHISYYNGGNAVTRTGLGTWAGAVYSNQCVIGAGTSAPLQVWSGNVAHVALWTKALTAAQVLALATV